MVTLHKRFSQKNASIQTQKIVQYTLFVKNLWKQKQKHSIKTKKRHNRKTDIKN